MESVYVSYLSSYANTLYVQQKIPLQKHDTWIVNMRVKGRQLASSTDIKSSTELMREIWSTVLGQCMRHSIWTKNISTEEIQKRSYQRHLHSPFTSPSVLNTCAEFLHQAQSIKHQLLKWRVTFRGGDKGLFRMQ